jgi:hypothetical protein
MAFASGVSSRAGFEPRGSHFGPSSNEAAPSETA